MPYERRICAFIDILGFKEHIERSVSEAEYIQEIKAAIDNIKEMGDTNVHLKSQLVTQFSDSIVISYLFDEPAACFHVLNDLGISVIQITNRGFLLRGGCVVGDLVHTDDYVFGPAMNHAYEIESKIAVFPRIVIDKDVIIAGANAPKQDHTPEEELRYIGAMLKQDEDDLYFIDYISWENVVEALGADDYDYPGYLSRLGEILDRGLASTDPSILRKYEWIRKQFNGVIKNYRSMPKKHGYRIQNPDVWQAIAKIDLR